MIPLKKNASALALVALVAASGMGLSACVPLAIVGGAAGAGTLMLAAERRSNETQTADRTIEEDAQQSVVDALAGRGHVNVTSYYRKVLLTGEVPTEQDRQMVHSIVERTPQVQGVINELAIMPNSGPKQRSSDAFISGKVRARLIDANGAPANAVRVITERGTTYIMGRLTAHESEVVTQVVRQTSGVERVVRVIDLIVEPSGAAASAAAAGTAQSSGASTADASAEVVTSPVTQPVIEQAPQPIQVQTLPPVQ